MKLEKIIKEAIKRGWKKEECGDLSKYSIIICYGEFGGDIEFYDGDETIWEFDLERIEELKELCRVLWGEERRQLFTVIDECNGDDQFKEWEYHIFKLIHIDSWEERKKYLENNFKL